MRTLVHSVRLLGSVSVDDDRPDGWVLFDGDRVAAVGVGGELPRSDTSVDGRNGCLAPGFVDIHGHGGASAAFDDGPEAVRAARALHLAQW
jgi:N-acetylglucosamine-6-phosphate deacetylase